MLQRKPVNRLGFNGITEIKEHPWLKYYPWKDLYDKKLDAPFVPKNTDNFDKKYCEGPDKIGNETLERYQNYYKNEALSDIFINYSFDNILITNSTKIVNFKKNSNHNTYLNNIYNSSMQKKKINYNETNLNLNKNSVNNLLKNKIKITESVYLNNNISGNVNLSNMNNLSKNSPFKNRNNSININSIYSPNHVRNLSNMSNPKNSIKLINNNFQNIENDNEIINPSTKNIAFKNAYNNVNILKTRGKNLSISNNPNLSNINLMNNSNINLNNNININNSKTIINLKQTSAAQFKINDRILEKLPFIDQKSPNPKMFNSNIGLPKQILNSPLIKNGVFNINNQNLRKSANNKYSTISSNSTGSSTISMNFLHRRSGSTNSFKNY